MVLEVIAAAADLVEVTVDTLSEVALDEVGEAVLEPDLLDSSLETIQTQSLESLQLENQAFEAGSVVAQETESVRTMICRNESLAGDVHPITGVPFERKIIEFGGEKIEGTFAQFESHCTVDLPENLYQVSNREQFNYANNCLKTEVENNPELSKQFNTEQLEQIQNGDRPDGYVWHHAENPGELQLVEREVHDKTGHTGGQVIWGGGQENR